MPIEGSCLCGGLRFEIDDGAALSRLPWVQIYDGLPQYDTWVPGVAPTPSP